ncbi:MAG: class I SAM-dependent methyltransferase [Shewanella sp.]
MKLNAFEKRVVQHPLRVWLQHKIEAPLLMSMLPKPMASFQHALEIGCGFGQGIEVIRAHFGAERVTAVDLDIDMVSAAKARWHQDARALPGINFSVADGCQLPFATAQFDIVFNFAVFHHIPDWQVAVAEVVRVLKPGGFFVIEDLYRLAICNPLSRRLFDHPQHNRFTHIMLLDALEQAGFSIICQRNLLNLAGMILAQKPCEVRPHGLIPLAA